MFQQAANFVVDGGTFQDVNGDQHNHTNHHSLNVQGNNNNTTLSQNHTRTDNSVYTNVQGVNIEGIVSPGGQNTIGVQYQSYSPPTSINWDQFPTQLFLAFMAANPQLQLPSNDTPLSWSSQRGPGSYSSQPSLQSQLPPAHPSQFRASPQVFVESPLPQHPGSPPGLNEFLAPAFPDSGPGFLNFDTMRVQPLPQAHDDSSELSMSEPCSSLAGPPQTPPAQRIPHGTDIFAIPVHPSTAPPTPAPATPAPSINRVSIARSTSLLPGDAEMNGTVTLASPGIDASPVMADVPATCRMLTPLPLFSGVSDVQQDTAVLPDSNAIGKGDSGFFLSPPNPSKGDATIVPGISSTNRGMPASPAAPRKTKRQWLEKIGFKKAKVRETTSFS